MKRMIITSITLVVGGSFLFLFSNNEVAEDTSSSESGFVEITTKKYENKLNSYSAKKAELKKYDLSLNKIRELDIEIDEFMNDESISREEKISFLWDVLNEHPIDSKEFLYFIDVLSTLKPLELSLEISDLFHMASEDKSKAKIIRVLAEITSLTVELTESELDNYLDDFLLVKGFYESELEKDNSPRVLREIIKNYDSVISTEEYINFLENEISDINHGMSEIDIQKIKLSQAFISDNDEYLGKLLNDSINNKEIALSVLAYVEMSEQGILSKNKQATISNYIESSKEIIFNKKNIDMFDRVSWIDSYSKISGNDKKELIGYSIKNSSNPAEKAFLVAHYREEGVNLSNDDYEMLISELNVQLASVSDENEAAIIITAINSISNRSQ